MTGRETATMLAWPIGGILGITLTLHALAGLEPGALWDFVMGRQ